MNFLVIEGTVRKGRRSIHVARTVNQMINERGHDSRLFDMDDYEVPLLRTRRYEETEDHPAAIEKFGKIVENSEGVIIVTPEYNHTIPGALKNLLDHLYPEYRDKPFSYVTVSDGGFGGVRALDDLKSLTLTLNAHPGPGLPVSYVQEVFSDDGELIDETYRPRFEKFVENSIQFTSRIEQR